MTEEQARETYRVAWLRWRETDDEEEMDRLGKIMDGCQNAIANGPDDPRWREFAASLPGYLEWWEAFRKWGERAAEELEQLATSPEELSATLH